MKDIDLINKIKLHEKSGKTAIKWVSILVLIIATLINPTIEGFISALTVVLISYLAMIFIYCIALILIYLKRNFSKK